MAWQLRSYRDRARCVKRPIERSKYVYTSQAPGTEISAAGSTQTTRIAVCLRIAGSNSVGVAMNRPNAFERFLSEHRIETYRLERLNSGRHSIIVDHRGRHIAVSYSSARPSRVALNKLNHALGEAA